MVQVHRSGSSVSIPRRLSHHVPVVPIIDSQEFEQKLTKSGQAGMSTFWGCCFSGERTLETTLAGSPKSYVPDL